MRSAARQLDDTLSALADPTRRRVVELLKGGPRRAGELSEAVAMSAPAMSRHLRVLRTSGLVADAPAEDDARARVYTLQRAPFAQLSAWLAEVEAFWTDQLAGFKAFAESMAAAPSPSAHDPEQPE